MIIKKGIHNCKMNEKIIKIFEAADISIILNNE